MYGIPINSKGDRLVYLCNGFLCYYICLFGVVFIHAVGILPITYFATNYGEFLIASMVISNSYSVFNYFYGIAVEPDRPRTNIVLYDFFMGTILYPRIGVVDIKMIAECRWSWLTLMILTISCAYKQYETLGYVTREMGMMLVAHYLYSNATVKGEHCIPCTWDMFHEKFGWMLTFWNVTGVPFMYCFQSFYLLNTQTVDSKVTPIGCMWVIYALLLVAYYVFDTANAQKACWKTPGLKRGTFPQLPWNTIQEPVRCIITPNGVLLVDGWYAFARKLQYTGDILMALSWGLACGFKSPLPYFYCLFFVCMIIHRQSRDEVRCKEKYGHFWTLYVKAVPNVFVPDFSKLIRWLVTGEMPPLAEGISVVYPSQNMRIVAGAGYIAENEDDANNSGRSSSRSTRVKKA